MLIIKLLPENNFKNKKSIKKRRKKEQNDFTSRENVKINNEIHTVVCLPLSFCNTENFNRLLKLYKGKVLAPEELGVRDFVKDYVYDPIPYFKRAVLSAFLKYMNEDLKSYKTICIEDSDFRITQEYADVAKYARKFIILTESDINTQKFSDYCFLKLGTVVDIKKSTVLPDWDIYINLDEIFEDGRVIINFKKKDAIIHPDPDYFMCNEAISEVISYGIPVKTACAAFEVKGEQEINWSVNHRYKINGFNLT